MPFAQHNPQHQNIQFPHDPFLPFNPRTYLNEYYSTIGHENQALLHFLSDAYEHIFSDLSTAHLLEFGGGPTLYQLISAAKYMVSIDFSEYLATNLNEIQLWLHNAHDHFCWDRFIRYVLDYEHAQHTPAAVEQRAHLLRSKITRLLHCDIRNPNPLGEAFHQPYDIVSTNFVLESITTDLHDWNIFIDRITRFVRPHGYLIMCAITNASHYRVGDLYFPAVPISPTRIEQKLRQHHFSIWRAYFIAAEHQEVQGYQGIFMVLAKKDGH